MQTELNHNTVKRSAQSLDNPGFNQMEQSLNGALAEFSDESSLLSSVTAALAPIGEYSIKAWNSTSSYVRRHPVQVAVGVLAIGFVGAMLARRMNIPAIPRSADGRQY